MTTTEPPLDFRSDTVTQPDSAMRRAMAQAEVGDDVLDRDPTLARLEEEVAGLLGHEAALWVPTGSMGNLVALFVHLRPGDSVLAPSGAHIFENEVGTVSWLAGGSPVPLAWDGSPGAPAPQTLRKAATRSGPYFALRPRLFCLENTHNAAGGAVVPPAQTAALLHAARASGLVAHLDGARIWNAAVDLGVEPSALAAEFDTAMVCLSKGLGAPMGSVVCGTSAFVAEARRARKMFGGGVRQGGVVGAAGLVALERRHTLAADHAHAAALADGLRELGWNIAAAHTNVVMSEAEDPPATVRELASHGVLTVPGPAGVRWMTHAGISRSDVGSALARVARASCPENWSLAR